MTVKATDLEHWAGRLTATGDLPALVRRLILATSPARVSMRAGEGTRLAGFDGVVDLTGSHPYIPEGLSIWEMGVNADRRSKAESDYATRTANSLGVDPAQTTFVFVTPRRWVGKDDWVREKGGGPWRDVRVIDADDLEGWLSLAPPVGTWLASLLGMPTAGVHSVERYWEEWSSVTRPGLTPEVILAGWNDDPVTTLRGFLAGLPEGLGIRAESREVAAAFLAAALMTWGAEGERERARTLFVEDERVWASVVDQGRSSILVPLFDRRDRVMAAVGRGHHLILPLGRRETGRGRCLNLDRQFRRSLREALATLAPPDGQVDALATLGRRSLLALRRKLASVPAVHRPAWATPEQARTLVAPVLAGAWQTDHPGDQEVLALLAGRSYIEIEQDITRLAMEGDPPLRRTGRVWMVTSKEDAWQLIAPLLVEEDMRRFAAVAQHVLGQVDPALDLPAEQRLLASFLGRVLPHSGLLREDLTDSLALMGASSSEVEWLLPEPPQVAVDRIVRQVLSATTTEAWSSLAWVLPKLAEAAPEVFLSTLERALSTQKPPLAELFQDRQDDPLGPSSPHTALLWALERLAWSPAYFLRVTVILGRLVQIDPGGKLVNRPANSLREIFVTWYRNTAARPEEKLRALDVLRAQLPEVAWPLLLALVPAGPDQAHPTNRPDWRDWTQDQGPEVPHAEFGAVLSGVIDRLLVDSREDADRSLKLLGLHRAMTCAQQAMVRQHLAQALANVNVEARVRTWEKLREFVARQQEFPDAEWALRGENLAALEQLRDSLLPSDPVWRHRWLFGHAPLTGQPWPSGESSARFDLLTRLRLEAVQELLEREGVAGVHRLINHLEKPEQAQWVGRALGQLPASPLEAPEHLHTFLRQGEAGNLLVVGFVQLWINRQGREPLEELLGCVAESWTAEECAFMLRLLPADERNWTLVEGFGERVTELYWQGLDLYALDMENLPLARRAFGMFRCFGRPGAAFDLTRLSRIALAGEEWHDLLHALANEEGIQHRAYELQEVLDGLVDQPDMDPLELARLAWLYLPLYRFGSAPRALTRGLLTDASLYAEMVALAFPDVAAREAMSVQEEAHRERAHDLIRVLRGVPGADESGAIDVAALQEWVQRARERLQTLGRLGIGDAQMGELLATAHPAADGQWPPPEVCAVVEQVASESLEDGLRVGRYNLRGMTRRSLDSGGDQERDLVEHYRSQAERCDGRWPRTAACMRRLAEQYEAEARRHDDDANLTQDRWR